MSTNNSNSSGTAVNNGGWVTVPVSNVNYPLINSYPVYTFTIGPAPQQTAPAPTQMPLPNIDAGEKKKDSDGCKCKKCKEFFEFAEPNQTDGTLICWACRNGY